MHFKVMYKNDRMKFFGTLLLLFILMAFSCNKQVANSLKCNIGETYKSNEAKLTIRQGVWGTVAFTEGNCMPMIGGSPDCKTCPVKRTIRIYEYATMADASQDDQSPIFFKTIETKLVKELEADDEGFFQTELAPGRYTIVVLEEDKLYANGSDGQGGINPVTVNDGAEKMDININYKATY